MRRGGVGLLLVACLALATACQRGPAEDLLREELQRELDVAFEEGLFTITSLRRMGSAPFTGEANASSGLHLYYDAVLELRRDYALTAWKGLNVGTLAFVVGATDAGVSGIRARGNVAGDRLAVHGRLSYVKREGAWARSDAPTPRPPEVQQPAGTTVGAGPKRMLDEIRASVQTAGERQQGTHDSVIVNELQTAVSRIELRLAHLDGELTLGSGPRPGTYHRFGLALSEFAQESGFPLHSYESEGSIENGALLRSRLLDFSLVQSDLAETLYQGWTENGILPNRRLRAVASLWPEAVHLVTFEGSGIETLDDLKGRKVGVGRRGSGTRFNVLTIAATTVIDIEQPPEVLDMGVTEGVAALESGRIAALFVTSAVPSSALQALAARRSDVRFCSIDAPVVKRLAKEHFAYYDLTVDARTYPGQNEPFQTIGLAAALFTTEQVEDAAVRRVLELLVNRADTLSGQYFRAGFISPETMRLGLAVPLHPAAERFYEASQNAGPEGAESSDPTGSP